MQPFLPNISHYMYSWLEFSRIQLSPWRLMLNAALFICEDKHNPFYHTQYTRSLRAWLELTERMSRKYVKPLFNITQTIIDDKKYEVKQQSVFKKPFCNLEYFERLDFKKAQPKLLIVALMAGHHATLLRSTVKELLPFFEVYITDWIDASQVPLSAGRFDMDDFTQYVMEFTQFLGPNLHVMAVCQPTVPVLAAVALLAEEKQIYTPKSMVLIGGPIDASKSPTKVNAFAVGKDIAWFERMLISIVPSNYPGYMRRVYPGYLQLAGFISLNVKRHTDAHLQLFNDLMSEDDEKADRQKNFYDEYLSVMDMPAEFYLQTIKQVFQEYALAKGNLLYRQRKVNLSCITDCALLSIEGENDDIAGIGQTQAAISLCTGISENHKLYYMQKGVGHYGVFSGSKFKQFTVPVIKDFIYAADISFKKD